MFNDMSLYRHTNVIQKNELGKSDGHYFKAKQRF